LLTFLKHNVFTVLTRESYKLNTLIKTITEVMDKEKDNLKTCGLKLALERRPGERYI